MKRSIFLIIFLCLLLAKPLMSYAICDELITLYEERFELLEKYKIEIGNNYIQNKKKADLYNSKLQKIDKKYAKLINSLFSEQGGEYKLFENCCLHSQKDRIMFFVCKLIKYKRSGNAKSFLKDIPTDQQGLSSLWEIDNIVLREDLSYFSKYSFVQIFIDSIYQLACSDNKIALTRLLQISINADGWYAEELYKLILNLFEQYPDIIINNWHIIKEFNQTINFETTDYLVKADKILNLYSNKCSEKRDDSFKCIEIINFLKNNKDRFKEKTPKPDHQEIGIDDPSLH
ncbi:MAG: hypothetical protein ACMUIP_11955 [bacterium]